MAELTALTAGMPIVYGGNQTVPVSEELASAFAPGDHLVVVQTSGDLLHIPARSHGLVDRAVRAAHDAFRGFGAISDEQITVFYDRFAHFLADDNTFTAIARANATDVADAGGRGRSVTRLVLSPKMRADMISGLHVWRDAPSVRDRIIEQVDHERWRVEQRAAGLGVVGFVFEGRPNVFADATGVLRSGNTVVFRIGSDALGTARAIMAHAVEPALRAAGLPSGAVRLLDDPARSTGWALFNHRLLALAVARGSGHAVEQLGAVARQRGTPVSLHGTGGAWLVAGEHANAAWFESVVLASLDRKVCNTANVCAVPESRAAELVPRFLASLTEAGRRRQVAAKLHVAHGSEQWVPTEWFTRMVPVVRAVGPVEEPQAELIEVDRLGVEWEWEQSPEVALIVVADVPEAVSLFNTYSPRLVASLVSDDEVEHERFWATVDAPFVGNGFTRWVDGQFALDRPELGLSNWENGRLFGRSAVLSGDSVITVRTRAVQYDAELHR
jgi:glutamate-5-semialdehyde dehydrogenase